MTNGREYWLGTEREPFVEWNEDRFCREVLALRARLAVLEAVRVAGERFRERCELNWDWKAWREFRAALDAAKEGK